MLGQSTIADLSRTCTRPLLRYRGESLSIDLFDICVGGADLAREPLGGDGRVLGGVGGKGGNSGGDRSSLTGSVA